MKEAKTISEWVEQRLYRGYYTFTSENVKEHFICMSEKYIKTAINRLVKAGKIISPSKGFYVIVPIEYVLSGIVPATFYIDQMMSYLSRDYYIALLNASAFYGAAHQRPQTFSIVHTGGNLNNGVRAGIQYQFFKQKTINDTFIRKYKSKLGTINVSSPELTALDLIEHSSSIGGLNRACTVLEELIESIDFYGIDNSFFSIYGVPTYQRLGYILEEVLDASEQADIIYEHLLALNRTMRAIPLKAGKASTYSELNKRWKVYINHTIEIDE
ncbi:MAG: type IV toxin-antitoxin system AbiEi family antitoxin [Muribaculaceae bacterium]